MTIYLILSWLVTLLVVFSAAAFRPSIWGEEDRAGRFVVGVIAGPLAGLTAGSLVFILKHGGRFGWIDGQVFSPVYVAYTYVLWMSPLAYSGAIVFGLPFIVVARRLKAFCLWVFIPAGVIIAHLTVIAWMNLLFYHPYIGFRLCPFGLLQPAVCGGVAMAAFWLISEVPWTGTGYSSFRKENEPAHKRT